MENPGQFLCLYLIHASEDYIRICSSDPGLNRDCAQLPTQQRSIRHMQSFITGPFTEFVIPSSMYLAFFIPSGLQNDPMKLVQGMTTGICLPQYNHFRNLNPSFRSLDKVLQLLISNQSLDPADELPSDSP